MEGGAAVAVVLVVGAGAGVVVVAGVGVGVGVPASVAVAGSGDGVARPSSAAEKAVARCGTAASSTDRSPSQQAPTVAAHPMVQINR
jgi:hypothetical protein